MAKKPKAWDEAFERETYTPEEIEASDKRVAEIQRQIEAQHPDREKVIEGLQKCAAIHQGFICESCEYPGDECAVDDAIALLKKQEPVKPVPDTSYGARPWWFVCGNCKLSVNEDQKYCPNCGRAVKWDG